MSPDGPCPPPVALVADQGAVVTRAGGCAALVVETQPSNSLFSWSGARVVASTEPRFEVEAWWRRLGERPGAPLELAFPGGTFMLRDGAVGWWEDAAHWATQGWSPWEGRTSEAHHVHLAQDGRSVRAWIDGVEVPPFELWAEPAAGRVTFGLKGGPTDRARMWLDRVRWTPDPP
jgi:hypothetical protein